jgi:beta-glucosidase
MDPALMALFPPADDPFVGRAAPVPAVPPVPTMREPESGLAAMSEGGDRAHLRLAPADEDLIVEATARNERTVVAVMGGSAVVMPWIAAPAATLMLWYPGMEGGHALADVLTGAVPPGGRLPFAVPVRQDDLVHFDRDATTETYDLFHGQWHLDRRGIEPAFPFGFGLSTTTFALDDLHVGDAGDVVSVRVSNTGARDGVTVVQVYAGYEDSAYERPQARLVGFRRLELGAGRHAHVAVPLDLRMLDVRVGGAMVREPGRVTLRAGLHARDPGRTTTISV